MQEHAVWQEPRSRKWVAMMRKYVIGAFLVVALLAAIALVLYGFEHGAYNAVAIAALLLATAAICLGPFMRSHLEDVSVMCSVLDLHKARKDRHPVKIRVTVDNVEIGRDYGVVEFGDGQLIFTGLRTSFNFSRNSVRVVNWTTFYTDTELLFFQADGENLVLGINPISRVDPDDYYSLTPKYRKAMKAWLLADTEGSEAEVLPPNRLSFRSDFRSNADHYGWLGSLYLVYMVARWLASRDEPYYILAYIFPLVALMLITAYVVRTRRKNAEFIRKYSLPNSASLSQ